MDTPGHDPPAAPATDPPWRALIEARWDALHRAALGLDATSELKLSALGRECQRLAIIAAWFEAGGNITRAAARVGSNRRMLRKHIVGWRKDHPQLVPPPPDGPVAPSKRRRKRNREARRPASDRTEDALPPTLPPGAGGLPP